MQITVLGKSPAWQDADGACSGYLVEEDGACLLLDCGNGVFSKLRRYRDYTDIDAVVISHLHADHFLDLVPFAYALTYAPRQQPVPVDRWPGTDSPARPRLYAPRGARETFRRIVGAWGSEDLIEKAFELIEFDPAGTLDVGTLRISFHEVPHFTTTFAVSISSTNGGGRFTYGADSAPNDELVAFADGADLLLIEATLPRPEREGPRGHLTPSEAGAHGARARVGRLVITHISDELDELWAREEAEEAFGGPVLVAHEGAVYTVWAAAGALARGIARATVLLMPPERDLFANFERMRREMDELFGDVFDRTGLAPAKRGGFSPAVDVFYQGDPPRAVVQAELAGIDPDELTLEIEGRELVIAGHRRPDDAEGRLYQQLEIDFGPFRRVIPLGAEVIPNQARATYTDGILRIELPLARPEVRSRSVPIEVARGDDVLEHP